MALAFFAVFLLISSIFSYFQFDRIQEVLRQSFEEKLIIEGTSLINNSDNNPFVIPPLSVEQPVQIWVNELGNWQPFYTHDFFPEEAADLFLSIESDIPFDQGLVIDFDTLSLFVQKTSYSESSINSRGFVLAKSNSRLQSELSNIRIGLISSILLSGLAALIVAVLLANFLLMPLKKIVEKATLIKAGATMDRLPVSQSSRDVSELSLTINEMIARIENAILRQNKFFDSASHELKTPLANMLAEIDYQLESGKSTDKTKMLKSLKSEVLRLSQIVSDFLLMSQIKNQQITLKKEKVRVDDLLYDLLEKMRFSLNGKEVKVSIQSEDNSSFLISTDLSKMESILSNLISNAIKFSDSVDNIEVSLRSSSDHVSLIVRNSINPKQQLNQGHQLGLWLSQELAHKLEISMQVQKSETQFIASLSIPVNAHN